jgi:hypothetical protein
LFLKMVYHGPKAMEELVRYDPHLVVGILGGSAGTTRDAFQLLHDAQKFGAKVALFGRKINNAENQLAFVHFLRLIVEGQLGPAEAVRAYHAVLGKLGIRSNRPLDADLQLTDQAMSYAGGSRTAVPKKEAVETISACACNSHEPAAKAAAANNGSPHCGCDRPRVTESKPAAARQVLSQQQPRAAFSANGNGRPDFTRMSPAERLAYHRDRLGLGR